MSKQVQQGQESTKFDNLLDFISKETDSVQIKQFKRQSITKDISKKLEKLEKLESKKIEEKPKKIEPVTSIQVKKKEVVWLQ